MPDDKRGREKQARNADRRQRKRAIASELERMDEPEPEIDEGELALFETALEELEFPVTATEVVFEMGHQELEGIEQAYSVAELLPATESISFNRPEEVRVQVQRPSIATALKRIVEETDSIQGASLTGSQLETYEKTFLELKAIDAVDDDEGIPVLRDWILESLRENGELPGSRGVRRRAADYCRENGYEVRNDEWLGI
ncbi:hypothetical protein RH831_00370 [Halodesulfurarchaeum sp. HSR-GB]|uniref:DUF5789 family protein n=1 Tax=Halodesulfurarchaeum sp. HSR-GB TaxID=3074077 RepID=UPI002865F9CE|nr:hypothetical protein [Halodesulfurarchaeum sp. HSR-GB]MDR5655637.1 hypothetical protein [Halodesulfurarchaeum sp. HSR-GB]